MLLSGQLFNFSDVVFSQVTFPQDEMAAGWRADFKHPNWTLEGISFPYQNRDFFSPPHIMRSWHHRSEIVGVSSSSASSGNSLLLLDLKVIGLSYFSLCCLFITALGTSRKTILLGVYLTFICSVASLSLCFLRMWKDRFRMGVGSLDPTLSSVDQ